MKFPQVMILCTSFLLLLQLLVVESSPLNDSSVSSITRGSSLSSNGTSPYWLSPSGNIAFGFYLLPNSIDQYVVGIWFPKSSEKTLVWTANPNDLPLDKPSSILFTKEGKFVLRILPDNKEKPLLHDAAEPVSYAKLHDSGNFVLYGSDSQIVWESFDHPTDTILSGQKLNLGVNHLISSSGEYKLSVRGNQVAIVSTVYVTRVVTEITSELWDGQPATLNLDTAGKLYVVNSDSSIPEIVIYEDKYQQRKLKEEEDGTSNNVNGDYIYRATLESSGLILYKERINGNGSGDSLVLLWGSYQWSTFGTFCVFSLVILAVILAFGCMGFALVDDYKNNKDKYNIVAKEIELS